jgi:gluconate 2-dehydrogenase gamma chain
VANTTGVDRRALMQRALFLLGAVALPDIPEALAAPPKKQAKRFLDAERFGLLTAVADSMIPKTDTPGAVDVGVPAQFDALLGQWASVARRTELIAALAAIDAAAQAAHAKNFAALDSERRLNVLAAYDKSVPRTDAGYGKLKELLVVLYFFTEPGATQELRYEHTPGVWEPSIPVTPATRAWGGAGLI